MTKKEFCHIAGPTCLNPPGYSVGGSAANNPDGPRISATCYICGQHVCANCREKAGDVWVCEYCTKVVGP